MRTSQYITAKIIILTSLIIFGCKKDDVVVVNGSISKGYVGSGVGNVSLELDYNELSGTTYSAGFKNLDATTSGSSGNFSFEFDRVQAVNYRVIARKDGYEDAIYTIGGDEWTSAADNDLDIEIFEIAELEVRFTDDVSIGNPSQIVFELLPHSSGCADCCSSTVGTWPAVEDSYTCKVFANQTIQYEYTLIYSGSVREGEGSVSVTPGGPNVLEVRF